MCIKRQVSHSLSTLNSRQALRRGQIHEDMRGGAEIEEQNCILVAALHCAASIPLPVRQCWGEGERKNGSIVTISYEIFIRHICA